MGCIADARLAVGTAMTNEASAHASRVTAGLFLFVILGLLSPIGGVIVGAVAGDVGPHSSPPSTLVAPDPLSDSVAATAAEFRVDESGAATYSIPIYGVPGTAGVAPKISLNYSSQAGYGPLGKGWSIGGLSSISRCRATREAGDFIVSGVPADGNPHPINFSSTDRYCLDGQRLVPAQNGNAACPSASGMVVQNLRTEIDSFQRVCAYAPSGGTHGPSYFTVERKDGSTSWYGDRSSGSSANRPDGYFETSSPLDPSAALLWAQTRFQDSTGNYIDFIYSENPSGANTREHLISEIRYTGKTVLTGQTGSAQAPYAKIMFTYSAHPGAQWSKGFASGGLLTQTRRLESITACASVSSGCTASNQARFYQISYSISPSGSGQEILVGMQECRDSSQAVCLPATIFAWSQARFEFATRHAWNPGIFGSASKFKGMKLGDVNGDGRPDLVWLKEGGSGCSNETVNVAVGELDASGRQHFRPVTNAPICTSTDLAPLGDASWQLIDYNGDGRDDLFVAGGGAGDTWGIYPSLGEQGQVFNNTVNLIAGLSPAIPVHRPNGGIRAEHPQLSDLNGDGLLDVVYRRTTPPNYVGLYSRLMVRSGNDWAWGQERQVVRGIPETNYCNLPMPGYTCNVSYFDSLSNGIGAFQMYDFNGDAASDLVFYRDIVVSRDYTAGPCEDVPPDQLPQDLPRCHIQTVFKRISFQAPTSISATSMQFTEYANLLRHGGAYAHMTDGKQDRFADFNGDGLADRLESGRYLTFNTGIGFAAEVDIGVLPVDQDLIQILDINGDGRSDLLYPAANGNRQVFRARYGLATGALSSLSTIPGNNAAACEGSGCDPHGKMHIFSDLDADGAVDFFAIKIDANPDYYLSQSNARGTPRDVITRVVNGLGAITDITYAPLTNAALHRRDTGSRNGYNWGRGSPVTDLLMPSYAVARVSSSSPQADNPGAMATVHYRYAGAKLQSGGRGFLGFREIVTFDPNHVSGYVVTGTTYSQKFPFIGMPVSTVKRMVTSAYQVPSCLVGAISNTCYATPGQGFPGVGGSTFSTSTQVWESDVEVAGNAITAFTPGVQAPVHVRTMGTTEILRDPFTGTQTSKVETAFAYGGYGNAISTAVDTYTGTSTLTSTVITTNLYGESPSRWRLGRLTQSTVTHQRPGRPDVVRTVQFRYDMANTATGLLVEERTAPGGTIDLDLRKLYGLDSYGNRVQTVTCLPTTSNCAPSALDFHQPSIWGVHRYARTVYDSRGRYPTATYEPFWDAAGGQEHKTLTVLSRNIFGDVTHAYDVNGANKMAVAGEMGREYFTWVQTTSAGSAGDTTTGVRSLTTYRWCGTGTDQVSCPAGARFRKQVMVTEAPTQWTYFDVLGRPVMKAAESFNAGISGKDVAASCTTYDATGKPLGVSNPFFLPGVAGSNGPTVAATACTSGRAWATTAYDILGRPTQVTAPDGSIVTSSYNGLATTITDQRNNATTQRRNGKGELTQVTDANGLATTYSYYADGSLYYVRRDAGRGIVQNVFWYDALGRKIQQSDPDSGITRFRYNALGELVAQIDADDNRIENLYDARGRIWRKTAELADGTDESQSDFVFDTAANGLGQLASESITGTYAGWIGQTGAALNFSRSHNYDALGRPSASTTVIDGVSYPAAVAYDNRGRAWKAQDASGRWTKTDFTARSASLALCYSTAADTNPVCPNNANTYVRTLETDAWGHVVRERRGNSAAMDVSREYWADTGRLAGLCAGNQSTCSLMDEGYGWDAAGNLSTQRKESRYLEAFTYDSLNRLVEARLTMRNGVTANLVTRIMDYDVLGNICRKHDNSATYEDTYVGRAGCGVGGSGPYGGGGSGVLGPHQVGQTTDGNGAATFYYYDIRGNQTQRDAPGTSMDRTVGYSADGMAYQVRVGPSWQGRFWYGPDGQRYKAEQVDQGRRILYLGNVEVQILGGVTTYRRRIGGVLQQDVTGSTVTNRYLFHDRLGSLVRITDATGAVIHEMDFRAFGGRRSMTDPATAGGGGYPPVTYHGFTDHEMFGRLGIIHMNGRIYDSGLGRFMQVDPLIQAPDNAQSWNAYTYVFNNPLRYTDPTGMLGLEERQWLGAIIAIVGSIWTGGASMGWWAASMSSTQIFAIAVSTAFVSGAVATQSLKGGLRAAFGAMLTVGIGLAGWDTWQTIAAHAVTGGIMESLQGGNFGNGFLAAGLTAAFMPQAGHRNPAVRAVKGALIGGTISEATGGKFANGAISGAIQAAMSGSRDVTYDEGDGAQPMPDANETPESRRLVFDQISQNRELYGIKVPDGYSIKFDDRYMSLVDGKPQYCTVGCDDQIGEYGTVFGQHTRSLKMITIFRAGVQPYIASGVRWSNGRARITVTGRSISGYQTMVRTLGHEAAHARGIDINLSGAAYHPNAEMAGYQALQNYLNLFNGVTSR